MSPRNFMGCLSLLGLRLGLVSARAHTAREFGLILGDEPQPLAAGNSFGAQFFDHLHEQPGIIFNGGCWSAPLVANGGTVDGQRCRGADAGASGIVEAGDRIRREARGPEPLGFAIRMTLAAAARLAWLMGSVF